MTRPTLFIAAAVALSMGGFVAFRLFSSPAAHPSVAQPAEEAPVVRPDPEARVPEVRAPLRRMPAEPAPMMAQPTSDAAPTVEVVAEPIPLTDAGAPGLAQFVPKGLESQQAVVLESRDLVNAGRVDEAITVLLRAADAAAPRERDRLVLLGARIRMGQNQPDQAAQLLGRINSSEPDVQQGIDRVHGQIERARRAGAPTR